MRQYGIGEHLNLENQADIIISCISFEERCTAVCKNLKEQGKIRTVLLYHNTDACASASKNDDGCLDAINKWQSEIENHLKNLRIKYHIFAGRHRNIRIKLKAIKEIILEIKNYLGEDSKRPVIGLDVTCFSRIDLIILLDYLFDFFPNAIVKTIYVRPNEHDNTWLTKGYSAIDSIIGFSGCYDYLKKDLLVILSGFEKERPQNYIDAYEPDKIMFGSSYTHPTKAMFGAMTKDVKDYFLEQYKNTIAFDFSADSISACLSDLESAVTPELANHNVIVAPLCTKLSVIATFLYAKKHPEIQLAYCYPKEYNWERYSTGMEQFYIDDIKRDW